MQHILIIGSVWPEPNSSAAGSRMMQLIALFQENGFKITFASSASDSDFMVDLASLKIDKKTIELNNNSFDVFVKELQPSMVMFDRFMTEEQYGWRVAEHCPNALRILDTEDLHCLRLARQKAFVEKRDFIERDLFSDVAKREIASILRCDVSLIISEYEMELLQTFFKVAKNLLYYIPFLLEEINNDTSEKCLKYEERQHFVFVGNFFHEPNYNAVLFLKEEIWPLIKKKLPDAELHIYGAYMSQKVQQLNNAEQRFLVKGRAANSRTVIENARVFLAPLRFGAGIKGKLIETMQCGTPNITTTIGAESMCGELPWNGFIIDNANEFAESAVELYNTESVWKQCQKNGIEIINKRYLKSNFANAFLKQIIQIRSKLMEHRQNNFVGAMLMHQSMQSTKYMSRWIELKNKM